MDLLQPPKGTRDFYPADLALRNWLFAIFRDTARRYGFQEFDGPILESEELFVRKQGEEIVDQLYNFEDKGGRRVCLRPEMTPTLARMILARNQELAKPLKWFSLSQCFRYERMSRGRKREHYQWNLDIVGEESLLAEVEIISAIASALLKIGLKDNEFIIGLNNRILMQDLFQCLKIPPSRYLEVIMIIDKKDKVESQILRDLLKQKDLTESQLNALEEVLNFRDLALVKNFLEKNNGPLQGYQMLASLFRDLSHSPAKNMCKFEMGIVRGLSYYTGTVFEVYDTEKQFRAICGGGRYDRLLETLGGQPQPAVGAGFGDVVILEILQAKQRLPGLDFSVDDFIIPFSDEQVPLALNLAARLREKNRVVDLALGLKKLKKNMADANRRKAKRVILVAPDELRYGQVVVKDMLTGQEEKISLESL